MPDKRAIAKHELLREFTAILHRHDPMGIKSEDEEEYEGEALSILSRFTESALHAGEDENVVFTVAAGIVIECFNFWFENLADGMNLEALTLELLTVYVNSFPEPEVAKPEAEALG